MDFLQGTGHIFLFYLILFVVLCITPFFKFWERLVERLDRVELNGERWALVHYIIAAPALAACVVIAHLFQFHKELHVSFIYAFAPASFVVLPLWTAFFGTAAWERAKKRVGLGHAGVLLFCYGGFGAAGTNIHDVLWCGRATDLYTRFHAGGADLFPWVELMHAPTRDYRTFGFFMFIHVLIGLTVAHVTYFRLLHLDKLERKFKPLALGFAGAAFLGLAISLTDWPDLIGPPILHTSIIAAAVISSCFLFHRSGLALSRLRPAHDLSSPAG